MKGKIEIQPVQTDVFRQGQSLNRFLHTHLEGKLQAGMVIAVTSKIVSVAEGRVVAKADASKRELVEKEAEVHLGEGGYGIELTIKHGLLIASAGIDESNSETGGYILYPASPYGSAEKIGRYLRKEFGIAKLGVILTDSHTMPLRRGVTGISLAHWGFQATRSLVGAPDLFGQPLKFTSIDVADSLAAMAVFTMGEAEDRCPLATIAGAEIVFTEKSSPDEISIPLVEDLYYPLLKPAIQNRKPAG